MAESKINLLNRLVDYFLVVGLSEEEEPEVMFVENGQPIFKPQLIDRYPVKDYEDIPFPPGVEIFCIPKGVTVMSSIELPKYHHFAATLGNGDRLHGTCLRFYEPVPDKLVPKIQKHIDQAKAGTEPAETTESEPNEGTATSAGTGNGEGGGQVRLPTSPKPTPDPGHEGTKANLKDASATPASPNRDGGEDAAAGADDDAKCANPLAVEEIDIGLTNLPPPETKRSFSARARGTVSTAHSTDDTDLIPPMSPPSSPPRTITETEASTTSPHVSTRPRQHPAPAPQHRAGDAFAAPPRQRSAPDVHKRAARVKRVRMKPASMASGMMRRDKKGDGDDGWGRRKSVMYATKCICIVSHYGFFDQYLNFLRELYRISLSPSSIPMERYIVNFARETPLPPQGCLKIQYRIGQKVLLFSRPPPNRPIDYPPFPYHDLFRVITPHTAVQLLTALLLEYRVVLVSTPYTNLTLVSELLIRLMYPFQYEHVYIPILPKTLIDFLAAPMPFCIGIPREFLDGDLKDILIDKDEMVLVDLDHNEIYASNPIQQLPPAERKKLSRRLKPLERLCRDRRKMTDVEIRAFEGRDSAFNYVPSPDELDSLVQSIPKVDDGEVTSVQAAFLRVFVSLFRDYQRFLIPLPKTSPAKKPKKGRDPSDIGSMGTLGFIPEAAPSFKIKDFIKRQPKEARPFLERFLPTQAFSRFSDQRVAPGPMPGESENYDIKYFEESIIAKNNRSRFRFTKPTPFLDSKQFDLKESLPAPDPDAAGLPEGRVYQHQYFPRLDPNLFQALRTFETSEPIMKSYSRLNPGLVSARRGRVGKSMHSIPMLVQEMSMSNLHRAGKLSRMGSKSYFKDVPEDEKAIRKGSAAGYSPRAKKPAGRKMTE